MLKLFLNNLMRRITSCKSTVIQIN